jgi:cytosine/adenosine deaminase-related metal-dependent hydrolase
MNLFLKNAQYVDWKTLSFDACHIMLREGCDSPEFSHGPFIIPPTEGKNKIIDCDGMIVTHSFVNAHHHAYSALARGMPGPAVPPASFLEILSNIWWVLDRAHDSETLEASALFTALECAKKGVTFVIDHHSSPECIEGSLETLAKAFDQAGLSHLLCYEVTDRDGPDKALQGIAETGQYLKKRQGLVGLHASFTVGNDTLDKAVKLAEAHHAGIHMHVAEDRYDEDHSVQFYRMRTIERLCSAGVLGMPKTILAHCIHINESERALLRRSPAFAVQNAESNLNNRVGAFDDRGLGGNIMLGTDGMHSDMLRSSRAAFFTGGLTGGTSPAVIYSRLRKAHDYLHDNGFDGDGENNLVILKYAPPTPVTEENFTGHFIFGLEAGHVEHVISGGRLIVEHGRVLTLDEKEVSARAREAAMALWSRMGSLRKTGSWKKS